MFEQLLVVWPVGVGLAKTLVSLIIAFRMKALDLRGLGDTFDRVSLAALQCLPCELSSRAWHVQD